MRESGRQWNSLRYFDPAKIGEEMPVHPSVSLIRRQSERSVFLESLFPLTSQATGEKNTQHQGHSATGRIGVELAAAKISKQHNEENMTKQTSNKTGTVISTSATQGKIIRYRQRFGGIFLTVLSIGCLGALIGCGPKPQTGIVYLYPDTIGAENGQAVVLKAQASPFREESDWQYQWQIITGGEGAEVLATNIPEQHSDELTFKNVGLGNAKLYRCMIFRTGIFPETNYTTVFSLTVSGGLAADVGTPVSGCFKPGTFSPNSDSCCGRYVDGIRFPSPAGIWWLPKAGNKTMVITDTSNYTNYGKTPAILEVMDSTYTNRWCTNLPNTLQAFPVTTNRGYQVMILFTSNKPPTGQQFSLKVNWQ
jgi:hypothetical protein